MKNNSISDNLVYQRKLKGFTQEQLSEESSVTIRTIQRIEKGDVQPHLQTVKLLAVGLGIEVEDLIVLDDPKTETVQRKWMLLLHGSPFFGLVIPFANVLFPLFIWISKAEDNKIYDEHGRAIINFHCTINLLLIISLLLFFPFPGFNYFLTAAVFLFGIIFSLKNLMSALSSGTCYYPLSIPFLKSKKI
ncbi:helix-turn-helix domain-containing protein [Winogradskyella sp. SYSU M77433]|uniref:helix-turn-helix domain-containing protein n=1 Tax=Winogradskyella sp. SYSU M77433 TaxID=3042722 RepID=UPI0024805285|nr:helix-turn-helix domain-containing protein [Winogradskyella sp. SYSU M77433]MDH7914445.1 helix-turn-helix domain-containing protein [Winogradskyella sp. SYSU M77433]|tara:strand:- start:181 stop:750 length:570 start_codon:yes stop_codon:yes gene_type:complete